MGLSGILCDSDIDGIGWVGRGVVHASSASAQGRRASKVRALSRGGQWQATENCNINFPSTSAGSAPVWRRNRRKPPTKKIGGYLASSSAVVNKKEPKSKSSLVGLTLGGMDVGKNQDVGDILSIIKVKDREDDRGRGVGSWVEVFYKPVDNESTVADNADLNNGRERIVKLIGERRGYSYYPRTEAKMTTLILTEIYLNTFPLHPQVKVCTTKYMRMG